jgi:gamma-glutamyltranspeptidase/glutathione hydrolase
MASDRPTGREISTRSEIIARHAMAATSQPLATQTALRILQSGGSAVDAAIAANAVLCLTEPTGCGLGGDLFAIVWDSASQRLHGLNGSGRSPAGLTRDVFQNAGLEKIPANGPLPVSVPGCVDGWFTLHERFGKLPMTAVLDPAIRYAREGFPLTEVIARDWDRGAAKLREQPGFRETFLPDDRAPAKGEIFRNEALANTLESIARGGRDAFYEGDIARTIDAFMERIGGYLRHSDLAAHRSEWVDPVSSDYRGYQLWELPPNGQGIAALQMLNILEGFDLRSSGFGSPDHLHWLVEAKKLAFADRARFYADPAFSSIPVAELISKDYAASRRALIDPARAALAVEPGSPALEHGDTVYLTVADSDRNMVSLIQSNYSGFGSGLCPDGLGFCLQNRGELFDLAEGKPNSYAPGKRPFHTIIPAFVTRNGRPWLSFGVMGGATQPQGHVQILLNLIDFDMNLQEAGDAPRVVHTGSSEPTGEVMTTGGRVQLESGFPYATVRELLERGHLIGTEIGVFGGYQAILYDNERDVYYGASDSRKDGQAAGY